MAADFVEPFDLGDFFDDNTGFVGTGLSWQNLGRRPKSFLQLYAGQDWYLEFPLFQMFGHLLPLVGYSVIWLLTPNPDDESPQIEKGVGAGIEIPQDGLVRVTVSAVETSPLVGAYWHELRVQYGENKLTPFRGIIQVDPANRVTSL